MHSRIVPIFFINPAFIPIQVQLVHPKGHQNVFGLPVLLIRILIFHTCISHDAAASGIISVMRCRDIGQAVLFHLLYDRFARFRDNAFMPEFLAESIAKIMMLFHIDLDVADRTVVLFQTDCIGIRLRLSIF